MFVWIHPGHYRNSYWMRNISHWTVTKLYLFIPQTTCQEGSFSIYLLPLSCSWWSGGNGGRGSSSPRPKNSWLWWSGCRGRGVAVGMWAASASSSDALLLDRERRGGRRNLKPRGRPGNKKVWRQRMKQGSTRRAFLVLYFYCDRGKLD